MRPQGKPLFKTDVTKEQLAELRFMQDESTKLLREVAQADLWTFVTEVLWPDEAKKHYQESLHRPICDWITQTETGGRKLLLIPRQHRKTYLTTIAHSVWRIVRDPNIRIILVSALDDTAQVFTQLVKRQFQHNPHLRRAFPEFAVSPNVQFGRTYEFTHPARTTQNLVDPTFRAFYLGAPVAGRRADIIICDDVIEKKHVTTPEQADKSLRDFNDLLPIVDRTGMYNQFFVIGTRWAYNDVYGALLGEDRGDEATVGVDANNRRWDAVVRHAAEDDRGGPDLYTGTPIFSNEFTRESLMALLDEYRQDPKRGEEDFWKQMMNLCVSPGGRKFEDTWFNTWVPRQACPPSFAMSYIVCDSASKDEQVLMRGDFTVAMVVNFDQYGRLWVTDGIRSDKLKGADLIRELISMSQRHGLQYGTNVTNFVKEKVGEDTFFGWIRSEFARAHMPITVFPVQVRGQGRKYVRIVEALQHPIQARQVHFVETFPRALWQVIVDEATHLGQWSHDDAIDALSLAFHPDIRITPASFAGGWRVPSSGAPQLSTGDNNPAASMRPGAQGGRIYPVVEGAESIWKGMEEQYVTNDGTILANPAGVTLPKWQK